MTRRQQLSLAASTHTPRHRHPHPPLGAGQVSLPQGRNVRPAARTAGRDPNCRQERPDFWKAINGYTDNPRLATAKYGQTLAAEIIAELAVIFKEFA